MKINSIYLAFHGEQNYTGIGTPIVVVRTQGCPFRCYKATMGVLCDTPEALERHGGTTRSMTPEEVIAEVNHLAAGRINSILLTGGDPLWDLDKDLKQFIGMCTVDNAYNVVVETSGHLDFRPYKIATSQMAGSLGFMLDWKLQSAGLDPKGSIFTNDDDPVTLTDLTKRDGIKFVIADEKDLHEAVKVAIEIQRQASLFSEKGLEGAPMLYFGPYFGGDLSATDIFLHLLRCTDLDLKKVKMTMQIHKYAQIPKETLVQTILDPLT